MTLRRLIAAIAGSLLLAALAAALPPAAMAPARAEEGFSTAIRDLPLMPGLAEVPGAGVVFDKPTGRIVETYAEGRATPAEISAFYARTLPQLGWAPAGTNLYRREGEQLALQVAPRRGGGATVRFTLSPL